MSSGNLTRKCLWIKRSACIGQDAIYCGEPVGYRMVEDGGEPGAEKVREYKPYCDEHQMRVEEMRDV